MCAIFHNHIDFCLSIQLVSSNRNCVYAEQIQFDIMFRYCYCDKIVKSLKIEDNTIQSAFSMIMLLLLLRQLLILLCVGSDRKKINSII